MSQTGHRYLNTLGAEDPGFAPDLLELEIRTLPPENGLALWSSDGHSLYYKERGRGIWRIAASGGEPELLVRFDDPERPCIRSEWASDGKRFYFTRAEYEGDI